MGWPRSVPVTGALGAAIVAMLVAAGPAAAQAPEIVVGVQVHGNTVTPDEQIVRIAGLRVGDPFTDGLLDRAAARLRDTGRFERVEIRKRFASIADPSRILVVVLVDEGPVRIVVGSDQAPHVERRRLANLMIMPVLGFEDGYGTTYGARLAVADVAGGASRVSVPLTWGARRRAAVELQKDLDWPGAPRVSAGAGIERRSHPFYAADADRRAAWARVEWQPVRPIRAGTTATWQRVSLLGEELSGPSAAADVVLDTRLDAVLPRNAVYARASIERYGFAGRAFTARRLEARGYVGTPGQAVIVLRARREDTSGPAPAFFQSLLGGAGSVRGFAAGRAVGDTLVTGSAVVRVPLTSPLDLARLGVSAFVDTGAVHDSGERLGDQRWATGAGGGIWMGAAVFHLSLVAAHGFGAGMRLHLSVGVSF